MKKYLELLKNIGILTLSNFGSKILSFLLVPLYTAMLTAEEYGNFDFINVTISLLIPLLTLNVSEAALRFLLDSKRSENEKKDITYITFKYAMISIVIVAIFSVINYIFNFVLFFYLQQSVVYARILPKVNYDRKRNFKQLK